MEAFGYLKSVKARKEHKCNFCGYPINAGEVYHAQTFKNDEMYTWKAHLKCSKLVTELDMDGDDGITTQDFYEYITEEYKNILIDDNLEFYESKDFRYPSFKEQIDFVYSKIKEREITN